MNLIERLGAAALLFAGMLIVLVIAATRPAHGNTPNVEDSAWYQAYVAFCRQDPSRCLWRPPVTIASTHANRRLLHEVNTDVNNRVRYVTDIEHFGVSDHWSYPDDGMGDCEDYAIEKHRELLARGIPPGAMAIRIVGVRRNDENELHAVLIVRDETAELVLDNARPEILEVGQTPYVWLAELYL